MTVHMLNNYPVAWNQSRYTCCHNKVLFVLANKLTELFVGIQFVQVFANLCHFHADHYPFHLHYLLHQIFDANVVEIPGYPRFNISIRAVILEK